MVALAKARIFICMATFFLGVGGLGAVKSLQGVVARLNSMRILVGMPVPQKLPPLLHPSFLRLNCPERRCQDWYTPTN